MLRGPECSHQPQVVKQCLPSFATAKEHRSFQEKRRKLWLKFSQKVKRQRSRICAKGRVQERSIFKENLFNVLKACAEID